MFTKHEKIKKIVFKKINPGNKQGIKQNYAMTA
jgi:hypothetical protein